MVANDGFAAKELKKRQQGGGKFFCLSQINEFVWMNPKEANACALESRSCYANGTEWRSASPNSVMAWLSNSLAVVKKRVSENGGISRHGWIAVVQSQFDLCRKYVLWYKIVC